MKRPVLLVGILPMALVALTGAGPAGRDFESVGSDRQAIRELLNTYTKAVSSRDEALFETLLLNRSIPFSSADQAIESSTRKEGSSNYEDFRKGVFSGPRFTQRFRQVRISQDGPLADVSLVFVNTAADGVSWGWKTMQLLKVDGRWRIASEFYTGHRGGPGTPR